MVGAFHRQEWTLEGLCTLNHSPHPKVRAARAGLMTDDLFDKDHQMAGSDLPRHIVDRFEKRWAQKLEAQARNWQSVKPDGRTSTDRGVPVVRRRKRAKPAKAPAA
jgi:hypothetical protein